MNSSKCKSKMEKSLTMIIAITVILLFLCSSFIVLFDFKTIDINNNLEGSNTVINSNSETKTEIKDPNSEQMVTMDPDLKIRKLSTSEYPSFLKETNSNESSPSSPPAEMNRARGSRGEAYESEDNNDYQSADDLSGVQFPITVLNSMLSTPNDVDIFKIKLEGGAKPVDNLTVKLSYLYSDDWLTEYYTYFYISLYGRFESKYLLMKVVSCRVYDWYDPEDCLPATIHAFDTTDYFIKISAYKTYTYADGSINYNLQITKDHYYPDDDNQVMEMADEVVGPITKKTVTMNTDLFDWYYIDTENPINYSTNFSFTIDITKSKNMETETISGQMISFVPELHVLFYYQNYKGTFLGKEVVGNQYRKYGQTEPIVHYEHFARVPIKTLRFYIGIYVQTYGRTSNGDGEYLWGEGYCDGWAEYEITKLKAKPMIPPVLKEAKVQAPVGKVYNKFTYTVKYSDENNDKPKKITLTIDNLPKTYNMLKFDDTDNNYQDGCIYKYSLDGSVFSTAEEVHEFSIFAEDVEMKAERLKGIGPIITDNILPASRPSSEDQYIINEDDPVSYSDLNDTFEDPDNDTLYYRLSTDSKKWSKIYNSENITINVVTLTDDNDRTSKYLEFKPKKNKYNRLQGQKFGSEIVYINVSDDNPDNPEHPDENGNLTRAHYMLIPFELELIIMEINDPPQIRTPFKYTQNLVNGELVLNEDQSYLGFDLNTVFWDPIENNPLIYSVRNNNNIKVKFYKNSTGDFMDLYPKENWSGMESLEIVASDGEAWVSDILKIRVVPVNDNPYLNYTPKQIIYENKWFNTTFSANDDVDNEPIYFETNLFDVLELPKENYYFNVETGELRFKPGNKNVGTYKDIWISVKDYSGGKTIQYIIFEILNTPDKPEPKILSPKNGDRYLDTSFIDFRSDYSDPDDEVLIEPHKFEWYSNNDGLLSTEQNFRGQLTAGDHVITLKVLDSELNGTKSIEVRIVSESDLDRDKDKIPDYWEILYFLNENNPHDAKEDPDSDTYSNIEEYLGMDGRFGGFDDTDPNDPDEHPEKHYTEKKEQDISYIYNWLGLVIIIIFIMSVLFIIIRQARRQRKENEKLLDELEKPKEKAYWQDMFGRKYEIYAYEPIEIVCHNCLEKQEIQIPIRPLVVTCKKCKKRGVLYK